MLDMQIADTTVAFSFRIRRETGSESNIGPLPRKQRINKSTPDLFSHSPATEHAASEPSASPASSPPQLGYLLPRNLAAALKTLSDHELAILRHGVTEEQGRRKGKTLQPVAPPPDSKISRPSASMPAPARKPASAITCMSKSQKAEVEPLTAARSSAVRAAFKAGVKPGTIARQFGVTQAQVREALGRD